MVDYFWIAALAASLVAGLAQATRARLRLDDENRYRREIRPYVFKLVLFLSLPWALMGTLLLFESVNEATEFFEPHASRWVQFWYGFLFIESLVAVGWIAFFGGAEFYAKYPFLLNARRINARVLRVGSLAFLSVFWALFLLQ